MRIFLGLTTCAVLGLLASAAVDIDTNDTFRIVVAGGRRGCNNYLSAHECTMEKIGTNATVDLLWTDIFESGLQHWQLERVPDKADVYYIRPVNRPACETYLSAPPCGTDQVTMVNAPDGTGRQEWTLEPTDTNAYRIYLAKGREGCNAYLGVQTCDKGDLTIMSEKDDGSGRQNWLLQPINKFTATAPLEPFAFQPLKLGEIKPFGWLKTQLQIQADGLAGHLQDFYGNIKDSPWIGGDTDYSDMKESGPYWVNGMLPLAYQLEDERLLKDVRHFMDYVLAHQQEDGWIGPTEPKMLWTRMLILHAITQYAEAEPSKTEACVQLMHKFFNYTSNMLDSMHWSDQWTRVRWFELSVSVMWLLDNYPNGNEATLLNVLRQMRNQGDDWRNYFSEAQFPHDDPGYYTMLSHGVNNGMALKAYAAAYRYSHDPEDLKWTKRQVESLEKYHGRPSGIFACDEHLAGLDPSRGTELCTVVDTAYSYFYDYAVAGENVYADYGERLIYNALPGELTEDMWAHQYLEQFNQISAKHQEPFIWATDGPNSTIFGLAPNYPCCTANHPQGFPKFVSHMFFTMDNKTTLVAALLGPATVNTTLAHGNRVSVTADTLYPFSDTLSYDIQASKPCEFAFRVPLWATSSNITYFVNGQEPKRAAPDARQLVTVAIESGKTIIQVVIPMTAMAEHRRNGAVAIRRGPLVYAMPIDYTTKIVGRYYGRSRDYEFTASSPWQVAIDPDSLEYQGDATHVPQVPFSTEHPTVSMKAKVCLIDQWGLQKNSAAAPPQSPVQCANETQTVRLLPFGSTRLRIAEFPTMKK